MKKPNEKKEKVLKDKRDKKRLKRKDKKFVSGDFIRTSYQILEDQNLKIDRKILENFSFDLDDFLGKQNGSSRSIPPEGPIHIPKTFSLEDDPEIVFEKIRILRQKIMLLGSDEIRIDFSNCKNVDFACLFLLRVIIVEYRDTLKKVDRRLNMLNARPVIRIIESKTEQVNTKLIANHIIATAAVKESDQVPMAAMKFHVGSKKQSKYSENRKGSVATKIRGYINLCLLECKTTLTAEAKSELDGIISETLNNAEDHSPFDKWYSFGNFIMSADTSQDITGEVNLAFMNFGYSMYDGIEKTKDQNSQQYSDMTNLFNTLSKKDRFNNFTKENLFTLFALQEGVSRLKHEDKSRGTGTMTFIRSFQNLGDFQVAKKEHAHRLLIFSGKTMVRVDSKYRPFKKQDQFFISLNKSDNLAELPDKSHLKSLKTKFPGTLLIVKMALSKNHLHNKIQNEQ